MGKKLMAVIDRQSHKPAMVAVFVVTMVLAAAHQGFQAGGQIGGFFIEMIAR